MDEANRALDSSPERGLSMKKSEFQASKRAELAERLREVREDLYGEHGSQFMADAFNVPLQTWLNYEFGVMVPTEIVLKVQVLASVSARWLLTGEGEKYDRTRRGSG
jgi:hypothetical protein